MITYEIEQQIADLMNTKGKLLMFHKYKGKGRPRKSDYMEYSSYEERRDLECYDVLNCGFTTNYTKQKQ